MIDAFAKHPYGVNPVVVLEIDPEGAEYLADVMELQYLKSNDKGAKEIAEAFNEVLDYLKSLKERDTW